MTRRIRAAAAMALAMAAACSACLGETPVQPAKRETAPAARKGVYDTVEIRFQLPGISGNPFDFAENDVMATIRRPNGPAARIPAFFDGGATWRVRYTPDRPGPHAVAGITRNGKPIQPGGLSPTDFEVKGAPRPGFVRRDPEDAGRFVLDDGSGYYPIGHNVAWGDGKSITVPGVLAKMGKAGENWARIWMCHWDGKNLDWVPEKKIPLGTLDLEVARKWDAIVEAAEKSGVRFQMVLQHHGPYSTRTDSNWGDNPWNAKNGGFLSTPHEFFTSPRALALTRAKYRYIIARWGYSPSIMAWELFNEVQWTDAVHDGREDTVAGWHDAMAAFLKSQDTYRHLVTSSFKMDPRELGDRLDYWQPHAYVSDPMAAIAGLNGLNLNRPAFIGEIGPQGDLSRSDGAFIHRILWGSLMSEAAGAAQFWAWDVVERKNLYYAFKPAAAFVRWSGLDQKRGMKALGARVETKERGPLSFAPGAEWETAKGTEFTVSSSGEVVGLSGMPRFLQGQAHRAMFPSATFHVNYAAPGTFAVSIGQIARAGARVALSLDGETLESRAFPAADKDTNVDTVLRIAVPAGPHTVRLENTGADWVTLDRITLDPYAPRLGVLAKGNGSDAVLWVESRAADETPQAGTLVVPGFRPGNYRVRWWDVKTTKPLAEQNVSVASDGVLTVSTPSIRRDLAAVIQPEASNTRKPIS